MNQLHETIRALRQRLRTEFNPGEKLPDEQVLAASFGVSYPTVREAISRMVAEGALERRSGIGTFVLQSEPAGSFELLSFRPGVAAALSATGREVTLPISSMAIGEPDASAFPDFPSSRILNISRVYALDGQPVMFICDSIVMEYEEKCIDTGTGDWMSLLNR